MELLPKYIELYDMIIIGAGPSGLFASINLDSKKNNILILEKNEAPAKKLLLSGAGKCNITHAGTIEEFTKKYGLNGNFLKPAFHNFFNSDLISFFKKRGLNIIADSEGNYFPATYKSQDVLNILINEIKKKYISIKYNSKVVKIECCYPDTDKTNILPDNFSYSNSYFKITVNSNESYFSKHLVISTGGTSFPETGSSGDGYNFALSFGHTIVPPKPALSQLIIFNNPINSIPGTSFNDSEISLFRNNKKCITLSGELLVTHKGLSGPVILNMSRYVNPGDFLKICFIKKNQKSMNLKNYISQLFHDNSRESVKKFLKQFDLTSRFTELILNVSKIPENSICGNIDKFKKNELINNLTEYAVNISCYSEIKNAMVTAGGVSLNEINNKTMESKIIRNLYFTGEIIDIDGDCGGYNLQAAFSTAFLAARTYTNSLLKS
ncbi:NAD(P)/FAD-dependent oxidoreductase [Candidatus Dependentiae bacterium]|nr:NAD(P)/FAD-dependent oxidoreductase [Candidatus Dependentiae bacterium]